MADLFKQLDALVIRFDLAGVERTALEALGELDGPEARDAWQYVAWARFEQGRYREALEAADLAADPLRTAMAHFHLWEMDQASHALQGFVGEDAEEEAEAEWYRGLLLEFAGLDPTLHPEMFREPVRLSNADVDEVIAAAVASLPDPLILHLEDTILEVVDLPSAHPDVDPLLLGLYHGVDKLSRSVLDPVTVPPKVTVYRKNVERIAADRDEAVEEMRITLLHEIGHHFGMDEGQLGASGYD
ncbi:MAG: metallopeptidase family protein [Planctomycetota bacterium]|jgi:predicted Zn-dependent protease with MMP-like domain